jgi:hypothetical protein
MAQLTLNKSTDATVVRLVNLITGQNFSVQETDAKTVSVKTSDGTELHGTMTVIRYLIYSQKNASHISLISRDSVDSFYVSFFKFFLHI